MFHNKNGNLSFWGVVAAIIVALIIFSIDG